jgi:Tfp pilus assembly protein PilW
MTLIELLISMAVMGVIMVMLLTGWFALSKSYGFTVHSADARDSGRQAMQRLQREIRDAQKPTQGYLAGTTAQAPDAIIYRAQPYWIAFSTTFNDAGNSAAGISTDPTPTPIPSRPHLVVYRLYTNKQLWRYEDANGDGTLLNVALSGTNTANNLSEQSSGEGRRLIASDVVNLVSPAVPLFTYNYYDENGVLQSYDTVTGSARYSIIAVQLRLLIDLDPSKAPLYADLRGTAQLRNARQ